MNIVIVGAGEVGKHLAESLSSQKHNICIIDSSKELAEELNEKLDISILCDNGASVSVLAEANVAECDLFLALTSDDNINLVSASLAKAMGAEKTIARVRGRVLREEWLFDYKSHFNIDYLFGAERLAAVELAKYVRNPEGLLVEEIARGRIELQQCEVHASSEAIGKTLEQMELPERVRVALVQRGQESFVPAAAQDLQAGDIVTLFGETLSLPEALKLLNPNFIKEKEWNVVIFGGGEYGFALAQMLEGGKGKVRIIEKDPDLCHQLSNTLQKTVVLHGDGTSRSLLKEEQVGDADFFIATTADDEDNVMTCFQAKDLGTQYCVTLIHRADYADIVTQNKEKLGFLGAVSPRMATSRDLLRFVTGEKYNRFMSLPGGNIVLESVIGPKSKLAGKRVGEVNWPAGAGLVALLHGQEAVVPSAQDKLEEGDAVYGIVSPESLRAFVKLLG